MAGAGYLLYTAGQVLTAAQVNTLLMQQSVMVFATSAARDADLATVKSEGMFAYTKDLDRLWVYSGTVWVFVGTSSTAGRPGVILTDAAQTITTATLTDVTWGTEVSDVDGWTSGASATLTVPAGWDGRYAISFFGAWSATATSNAAIFINGGQTYQGHDPAAFNVISCGSPCRLLAVGDTIKVSVIHTAGANRDIVSRLEIIWLGR